MVISLAKRDRRKRSDSKYGRMFSALAFKRCFQTVLSKISALGASLRISQFSTLISSSNVSEDLKSRLICELLQFSEFDEFH